MDIDIGSTVVHHLLFALSLKLLSIVHWFIVCFQKRDSMILTAMSVNRVTLRETFRTSYSEMENSQFQLIPHLSAGRI